MLAKEDIVGLWRLAKYELLNLDTGNSEKIWGEKPKGYLQYTADGRVFALLAAEQRPVLRGLRMDPIGGEIADKAKAFDTTSGYVGTYEVTPDCILHTPEVAVAEGMVGRKMPRFARLENGHLVIESSVMGTPENLPHLPFRQKLKLTWERAE